MRRVLNGEPEALLKLHFWLTIGWFIAAIPVVMIAGLRNSIPLLVFISIYANVAGHFSAWQAARVECRQEQQEKESAQP